MNSTPDSPEKPKNTDDSEQVYEDEDLELANESSEDAPVLLEGEAEDVTEDLLEMEDFPEVEAESEEISESFPPSEPEPAPRKGGFFPMLFGGLVAGAIGFGAAVLLLPQLIGQSDEITRAVEGVEGNAAGLAELTSRVEEIGASIPEMPDTSGLEASIAALETSVGQISDGVSGIGQDIAANRTSVEGGLSDLTTQLAELRDRVAALEVESGNANSAQADEAAAQLSAFQADLEGLVAEAENRIVAAEEKAQAILAEAEAAAAAKEADAARQAELAEQRAALAELKTALDAGASYTDIVKLLGDVPPELTQHAETGVPTLTALQQNFAPAARSALATAQAVPENASTGERLTAFLRRQTNARSLAPKEGNDTDAVLSRAEAYLSEGKLSETLSEVSALPEDARNAMAGWLADAETRQSAMQAVDALSSKLN